MPAVEEPMSDDDRLRRWAASGAMALTGPADGPPLGPPDVLVPRLHAIAGLFHERTEQLGRPVAVDPLGLLGERAAIAGFSRRGPVSCGGATHLVAAADGWIAVSLARPDDLDLLPAWLGIEPSDEPWTSVEDAVSARHRHDAVAAAIELGLPVAALGETTAPSITAPSNRGSNPTALPVLWRRLGEAPARPDLDGLFVADLSSLWAGPLCGSLLAAAGASVVKVESTRRPDGARRGPEAFYDLLNAGKRSVALDFSTAGGRDALEGLIRRADVVIEASRPRALRQLDIGAEELVRHGPQVWVSITAHGRGPDGGQRVGFGDDAAVAGGLVSWDGDRPCFCADAVADPIAGMTGAAAVVDALAGGGRWLIDVPMAAAAAWLAGPTLPAPPTATAVPPVARVAAGPAARIGEHTGAVLRELGIR